MAAIWLLVFLRYFFDGMHTGATLVFLFVKKLLKNCGRFMAAKQLLVFLRYFFDGI
jgi:hypothetical protein